MAAGARKRAWRDMVKFDITQDQWQRAANLAWHRDSSFRRNKKFSSALMHHFQGCLAEIAVCELYDSTVNEEIYEYGDGGHDFILNGYTCDVKSSSYKDPELWVAEGKVRADVYILAHVKDHEITLVGAAWAEDVKRAPKRAGCHVLTKDELNPIPRELEFKELVEGD